MAHGSIPHPFPVLMLVTDRSLCPLQRLPEVAAAVTTAGVNVVQLRERGVDEAELVRTAAAVHRAIDGRALLLINGLEAVARRSGADGVQLSEGAPLPAGPPRDLVWSRSVHSLERAVAADEEGIDLLVLGTIFASRSHPGGFTGGSAVIRQVCAAVTKPVIGIGGITDHNADAVIAAGAAGVAVISHILAAPDPVAAAAGLRATLDQAWQNRKHTMIHVTINGKAHQFERDLPLPELLLALDITHPRIAVALNGTVLRKEEHPTTVVKNGDELDVVRMVGGGM